MLSRILPILFLTSAMTLLAQVTTNPIAIAPGSDLPPIEAGVSQELAKWRAARYNDVRYKLNLKLEKMSPVLKGTIEIRLQNSIFDCQECPPISIILDWRKIKGNESLSTISNAEINGRQARLLISGAVSKGSGRIRAVDREGKVVGDKTPIGYEERDDHLIFREGVVMGENVIKFDFTSPILTSGSAITRYIDKEDGSEYLYSLFVPSDASTAFPVFDQPDLKARFELEAEYPNDWVVVANSDERKPTCDPPCFDKKIIDLLPAKRTWKSFRETKPISTYVFAFAAGPFERVSVPPALAGGTMPDANSPSGKSETSPPADAGGTDLGKTRKVKPEILEAYRNWVNKDVSVPTGGNPSGSEGVSSPPSKNTLPTGRVSASDSIYVRKSQAAKFKPHAAEVFRLNREAIKYFEEYFDYKFPFPKYDLVLIPEFPFGGMEHAGATFLRESSIIFPQEPTKNDHISRALLIFHEASHQWFGDTVTMRWFDDLWLKEGFATFTAYKAMERIMPNENAWKVFYERVKQAAYQTDSTKGTTPIYQEIKNLSAAKSAYGNIVYNKAPAFLRQAEFYLGEDKFRAAVRSFLKEHEFGNAGWEDLVKEFEAASVQDLRLWADTWIKRPGLPTIRTTYHQLTVDPKAPSSVHADLVGRVDTTQGWFFGSSQWGMKWNTYLDFGDERPDVRRDDFRADSVSSVSSFPVVKQVRLVFPNYQDYGYGIFLLDARSRDYVLKNIQNEKDPFLRSMMWGALWDSVREGELDPKEYVNLVVTILGSPAYRRPPQDDESTIALLLNRVGTAMNYYLPQPPTATERPPASVSRDGRPIGVGSNELSGSVEIMLMGEMQRSVNLGRRLTFYRAFLNVASSENARGYLKQILAGDTAGRSDEMPVKTKDKFDIVTRLLVLGDPEAPKLLAELERTETGDDAKRYAYAAKAGIPSAENKAKYWNDFVNNKEISESWIEAAFGPFNSIRHNELTLPYLQKALQELPNHKRSRKIFFVNGWLGAFIGGQRSEEALALVNKFLADNPDLDKDLRLKILENVDLIERAVKIRNKLGLQR